MVSIRRNESSWHAYVTIARAGLIFGLTISTLGFCYHVVLAAQPVQKQINSHNSHQNSAAYERGTDEAPITVKLLNTGESDAESAQETERIANKDAFDKTASKWTVGLTIALVIATMLQFIALLYQSYWLRSSVKLTREILVHDKRPFVFPVSLNQFFEKDLKTQEYHWRFRIGWKNSGDTPTKGLHIFSDFELRTTPFPVGHEFSAIIRSPATGFIGPDTILNSGLTPLPPERGITPDDIRGLQSNEKFLYLRGIAIYQDALLGKQKYITEICWQITVFGDPATFIPDDPAHRLRFDWSYNQEGNCIDNECSK